MARTAAWRKGDLTWTCGNQNWRQPGKYGLSEETPMQGWAWEFLRRNASYQASVDSGDDESAGKWGLVALVDYRKSFARLGETSRPKWLTLQTFELILGPQPPLSLTADQIVLVFDRRRTLQKDVLQRQLAEFVERLSLSDEHSWGKVLQKKNSGGRTYSLSSLLTCLRFADAVAQDRNIDAEELQKALGLTSARAGRELHEAYVKASSLIEKDYSRLLDQELSPLRSVPFALRRKSIPTRSKVLVIDAPPSWD